MLKILSQDTITRLPRLKITCSNTCALNKLDTFSMDHDSPLKVAKQRCPEGCALLQSASQAISSVKEQKMACQPGFMVDCL